MRRHSMVVIFGAACVLGIAISAAVLADRGVDLKSQQRLMPAPTAAESATTTPEASATAEPTEPPTVEPTYVLTPQPPMESPTEPEVTMPKTGIEGTVIDQATGKPISGAVAEVAGVGTATTDGDGHFLVVISDWKAVRKERHDTGKRVAVFGRVHVTIAADGYGTWEMTNVAVGEFGVRSLVAQLAEEAQQYDGSCEPMAYAAGKPECEGISVPGQDRSGVSELTALRGHTGSAAPIAVDTSCQGGRGGCSRLRLVSQEPLAGWGHRQRARCEPLL